MTCAPKTPLTLPGVRCERLAATSFDVYDDPAAQWFDVGAWRGSGVDYGFDVIDGAITNGNPYGP